MHAERTHAKCEGGKGPTRAISGKLSSKRGVVAAPGIPYVAIVQATRNSECVESIETSTQRWRRSDFALVGRSVCVPHRIRDVRLRGSYAQRAVGTRATGADPRRRWGPDSRLAWSRA